MKTQATRYIYRGDRFTAPALKGVAVYPVRRSDGRCIRGRNGNILVCLVDGLQLVVLARQLRLFWAVEHIVLLGLDKDNGE